MEAFVKHRGLVIPFDRANIDTDLIIPKQFLKAIDREGLGKNLFDALRYHDEGVPGSTAERMPNPQFALNQSRFRGASVLLTRANFGCGSSREHAVWALADYGFRCIVAPSFADIFFNNCIRNGILPVVLAESAVQQLFEEVQTVEGYALAIDLKTRKLTTPDGIDFNFELDSHAQYCLLNGLDQIDLTLQSADRIRAYERQRAVQEPWIFAAPQH